jgi:hypothetical protein
MPSIIPPNFEEDIFRFIFYSLNFIESMLFSSLVIPTTNIKITVGNANANFLTQVCQHFKKFCTIITGSQNCLHSLHYILAHVCVYIYIYTSIYIYI